MIIVYIFLDYLFGTVALVSGLLLIIFSDRIATRVLLEHPSLRFVLPYWVQRLQLIALGIFLILGGAFEFFS